MRINVGPNEAKAIELVEEWRAFQSSVRINVGPNFVPTCCGTIIIVSILRED